MGAKEEMKEKIAKTLAENKVVMFVSHSSGLGREVFQRMNLSSERSKVVETVEEFANYVQDLIVNEHAGVLLTTHDIFEKVTYASWKGVNIFGKDINIENLEKCFEEGLSVYLDSSGDIYEGFLD
ncbi:hypothetical protein CN495_08140 [Bacillus thuringiensis]|uniref:Uncharacterized protein n=1 Tax=Bacillus thuringiensis TaxID=1428 RepID=A0ABD6SAK0_BACTU|nr:hypothetical protein [Bacillus thuringiensis]PER55713.1 hypothetical protein CN495_08140 [Bacillus thuringiensis]